MIGEECNVEFNYAQKLVGAVCHYGRTVCHRPSLWQRCHRSAAADARHSRLIAGGSPKCRARLKHFRNAVFHPGPFYEKRLLAVYDEHEDACARAGRVLDSMASYLKRELDETKFPATRLPKIR